MKTNIKSPSSNFIIGNKSKKNKSLNIKVDLDINLTNLIVDSIETIEKLNDYYNTNGIKFKDDKEKKKYTECKDIINNKGIVFIVNALSDSRDSLESFLSKTGIEKAKTEENVIIIKGNSDV